MTAITAGEDLFDGARFRGARRLVGIRGTWGHQEQDAQQCHKRRNSSPSWNVHFHPKKEMSKCRAILDDVLGYHSGGSFWLDVP